MFCYAGVFECLSVVFLQNAAEGDFTSGFLHLRKSSLYFQFKSLFTVFWPASVVNYHMKSKHQIYLSSYYVCDLQIALKRKSR